MARRHLFQRLLRSYGTVVRCSKIPSPTLSSLLPQERCQNHLTKRKMNHVHSKASPADTPIGIGSPARIQKLIASQPDPLLAKEIFDMASRQPNFRHSYSAFHILILKLARARHFSLAHGLLHCRKAGGSPITPSLFSQLIRIYGEAQLPDKALSIFYSIPQFNTRPLPKHLNLVLQVLVAHPAYLHSAFDLFKSAERYRISPNTTSYNILIRAFCVNGRISIAYHLFNQMFQRNVVPDVESYRILMQGLCRRSQVNRAVDLLGDMLNKGFVPDTLSYTTLLNSLCRKKKLKEAYKLLCKMKVKGCNPDIVHYNTVILGLCREGRALDACKVLDDMASIGCLPNLVSYRSVVAGLCSQGMYIEAKNYTHEMISKGFSPHFSIFHVLINGFCKVGKIDDACELLEEMLNNGETPHIDTWEEIIPRICDVDDTVRDGNDLEEVCKVDITPDTRIVDAVAGLEEYLIRRIRPRCKGCLKTS